MAYIKFLGPKDTICSNKRSMTAPDSSTEIGSLESLSNCNVSALNFHLLKTNFFSGQDGLDAGVLGWLVSHDCLICILLGEFSSNSACTNISSFLYQLHKFA